jgi:murein DD-endopeptidase MepM/ murein hydrolase activator NlpD
VHYNHNTNKDILRVDIDKAASFILLLAIISFFIHLVLHNYNDTKKNYSENTLYTGQISENISPLPELEKQEILPKVVDSFKADDASQVIVAQKKINFKKIGNVFVFSIGKGDTLVEILKESGVEKYNLIATTIGKKYRTANIRPGDILQVENLSKNKIDLKIVLHNKAEISVREQGKKYSILVKDLIKTNIPQSHIVKVKKTTIQLSYESIQKAQLTQDLKRDLSNIVQLLRQEGVNQSKMEVIYESKSTKDEKLLYISTSNFKIYKYIDKSGNSQYVKQNGIVLSRENRKKTTNTGSFRISYPISNPVIGSSFGMRRHPILGRMRMHKGVDFRASRGTPIYAPADGIIVETSNGRGFGKHVRIRHNGVYTTLYAHLDNFARDKRVGTRVRKGEVIGYVGKTGMASGEHLHFEVHENGRPINPIKLIGSPVKEQVLVNQLSKRQMVAFKNYQSEVEKKARGL